MSNTHETRIEQDASGKKLTVNRDFSAPVQDVWDAWTQSHLLEQWWAPKPWKAETKSMDFSEGGAWLYAMVGPNGERHWSKVDFKSIDAINSFTTVDSFCDENGNISADFPSSAWAIHFKDNGSGTSVTVTLEFETQEGLKQLVEMGFKEGFTMGLGNLDELLASKA